MRLLFRPNLAASDVNAVHSAATGVRMGVLETVLVTLLVTIQIQATVGE